MHQNIVTGIDRIHAVLADPVIFKPGGFRNEGRTFFFGNHSAGETQSVYFKNVSRSKIQNCKNVIRNFADSRKVSLEKQVAMSVAGIIGLRF